MNQSLERLTTLLGKSNIEKLNNSKVAIVGLGGVGAVAAIALARNGINHLIIQDFDVVNKSNINRQIIATTKTIGRFKTDVLEEMIKDINPDCTVIKITEKYGLNCSLFNANPDFIIDAIDDFSNKIDLISYSLINNYKIISSMGMAKKLNSSKIAITEISKTSYDPIAKKVRKELRLRNINKPLPVVSSTEQPNDCLGLGSYMIVTATAGLLLADYVIKQIIEVNYDSK